MILIIGTLISGKKSRDDAIDHAFSVGTSGRGLVKLTRLLKRRTETLQEETEHKCRFCLQRLFFVLGRTKHGIFVSIDLLWLKRIYTRSFV